MFLAQYIIRSATALAVAVTLFALSSARSSPRAAARSAPVQLSLSVAPAVIVGGNQTTATVTLSAPADHRVEISTKSLNEEVARVEGNSQLALQQGSTSATFTVRTFGVASSTDVKLQVKSGPDTAEATLTIIPASVKTVTVSPSRVIGGNSATGTVALDGLAPANAGLVVQILLVREAASRLGTTTTTNLSAVSIPPTVSISPGASSATFSISTTPVASDTSVRITARTGDGSVREASTRLTDGTSNTISLSESTSSTATLTVAAPSLSKLLLNPGSVTGGNNSTGTVVLTGKAPSAGFAVSLSANNSGATVPPSVSMPAGADRADFAITTQPTNTTQNVTITASAAGNSLTQSGTNNLRQLPDGTSNTIIVGELRPGAVTAILSVTPLPPAVVSISATQADASKDGPTNGVVTVTRNGSTAQALTVFYSINDPSAGANPHPASSGVDFQQLPGQVNIPASSSSATITVIPIPDNKHGPELRVILQLVPPSNGTYTIQPGGNQAVIKIKQHQGP